MSAKGVKRSETKKTTGVAPPDKPDKMQRKNRIDATGAAILVVFSLLLGLNQAMVKIVNIGLQPVYQAGLRSALALVLVAAYAAFVRRSLRFNDGSLWPGLACGLLFGFEFLLLFQSLEWTSVSRASMFFYTMPFWVAVPAHYLIAGERLTGLRLAGLGIAMAGVALALVNNANPATDKAWIGDLMCLVASVMWAGIVLLARVSRLSRSKPEMQLVYQLLVSAVVLLLLAPLFGPLIRAPTPAILAIFAVQVAGIVSVGFLAWFWVLSVYPASDMASFGFLTPLFGVMAGWWLFDETVTPVFALAFAMVSAGIVLINRKPAPKGRRQGPPKGQRSGAGR